MKKSLIMLALLAAAGVSNAQFLAAGSQAGSASQAGASSGSTAAIILNQNVPETQDINATYTTRAEQILSGGTHDTTDVRYSGSQTLKTTPSIAMSGPASGPCTGVSGGVGLAGPGWGVGINGSAVMVDCRLRENTRVLGMAMQSLDGATNPQEKGELMVMFMDAARALSGYTDKLVADEKITPRARPQPVAK